MPGYFAYPLEDDEATGFFGGYRRPPVSSPSETSDDATVVPESGAAPAPSTAATDVLTYPNGKPVMDFNTGQPFPRPDRLDMRHNILTGQLIKAAIENGQEPWNKNLLFGPLFPAGSIMDYQRALGHPFGKFDPAYTNVTGYNVGVVGAAAGYDLEDLLKGSGLYNLWLGNSGKAETSYGLSKERALSIEQGYDDYKTGRWSRSDADDPPSASEP